MCRQGGVIYSRAYDLLQHARAYNADEEPIFEPYQYPVESSDWGRGVVKPERDELETPEWLETLGIRHKELRPFTAHERKRERVGQAPHLWHVDVRYCR